jgi:hypothetical protein
MTDLRAAVEGLRIDPRYSAHYLYGFDKCRAAVLALIPKDGVWVTEETLAGAVSGIGWALMTREQYAAAVLSRIREAQDAASPAATQVPPETGLASSDRGSGQP